MTWTTICRPAAVLLLGASLTAGCGVLDVSDPTIVEEADIANPDGAELLRRFALFQLYEGVSVSALHSGLLSDELFSQTFVSTVNLGETREYQIIDQRQSVELEEVWSRSAFASDPYVNWQAARTEAVKAQTWLQQHGTDAQQAHIGQMLAVRGYATLGLAEQFCPGFPLHEVVDDSPVYSGPLSTEEAFEYALAKFDSAVVYAADSARILDFARVGQARALLGLGRFADAGAAAAPVSTAFVWNAEYEGSVARQSLNWIQREAYRRSGGYVSVADQEGGNGLDYRSAGDPRIELTHRGTADDGVTEIYAPYALSNSPIVLASGIEARLIQAEAALNADDASWLTILNDLRAADGRPELTPLADPGTDAARVDLLFRERAFWLFATGHRLGDMRRLVAHYGRDPETVFPTGGYPQGGSYDAGTSLPFPPAFETPASPSITGCTSR